jgi:hypothetical protein
MYVILVAVCESFHICLIDLSLCNRMLLALPSRFLDRPNHAGVGIEGGAVAVSLLLKPSPLSVLVPSDGNEVGNVKLLPRRRNESDDDMSIVFAFEGAQGNHLLYVPGTRYPFIEQPRTTRYVYQVGTTF